MRSVLMLKGLLYALLFVFPLGVLLRVNIGDSVHFYPADIFLTIVSVVIIYECIQKKILFFDLPLAKPFAYFVLIAFISLLVNIRYLNPVHLTVSFLYLVRLVIFSSLLFVFHLIDKEYSEKYAQLLTLSGFTAVVLGLAQYIIFPDLRPYSVYGWDEHLYRIFSTYLDPNFSGGIFVLVLLMLIGLFKSKLFALDIKKSIPLILLTIIAIFLTYSRSSYIMFLVSFIFLIAMLFKKKYIYLVLLTFIVGLVLLPKNLPGEGVNLLRTTSIKAREIAIKNAVTILKDSPVLGVGYNSYRYTQQRYGYLEKNKWEIDHGSSSVPNSILFVLVTTGLIGLIFYLNFWKNVMQDLFLLTLKNGKLAGTIRPVLIASIIGLFIQSLFDNTLFYPFIMMWIFSLIGIMEKIRVEEK